MRFRVLGSGSTGNATLVEGAGTRLLIDAGLGPRTLAERLTAVAVDPGSIEAVLVSHEHEDHARGAAGFCAKWGARLAATPGTRAAARFDAASPAGCDTLVPGRSRYFGGLEVEAVAVPHDAAAPVAFVVSCGGESLGHATDLGHVSGRLTAAFAECTALLFESNYDDTLLDCSSYPWSLQERIRGPLGHLSNAMVSRYLGRGLGSRCRRLVLAHLSLHNNTPSLALASALAALVRAGRENVAVEACEPSGSDWIELGGSGSRAAPGAQLRLFPRDR